MDPADSIPDDIDALRAELVEERAARREAEARAVGAEAMVTHLKSVIAKLEHHRYAPSSERGRKLLDQAELQLEEFAADAAEEVAAIDP
jgi:transposase